MPEQTAIDREAEVDHHFSKLWDQYEANPAEFDNIHQFTVELMEDETFLDILKNHRTDLIGPRWAQLLNKFIWEHARHKAEYGAYHPQFSIFR